MIRVGFEATRLLMPVKTGEEFYATELVKSLYELLPNKDDITLHLYFHLRNPHADASLLELIRTQFPEVRIRVFGWRRGYGLTLSLWAKLDRLSLLHLPSPAAVQYLSCPLLVTFHDVLWARLPADGLRVEGGGRQEIHRQAAEKAAAIIANSHATKVDLVDVYGIPPDRVEVVHLGISSRFHPRADAHDYVRAKYGLGKFILNVASLQYRKNQVRLLHALKNLRRKHHIPHRLVFAGRDGHGAEDVRAACANLELQDAVKFLGYVPDEDIPYLYSAADLVIYPSIYEGFGLPVLEAMACGAVVATANTSSLPEVGGDAALYFNPYSCDEMAEVMLCGLNDHDLISTRRSLSLQQASKFSWDKNAVQTLALYEKLSRRSR